MKNWGGERLRSHRKEAASKIILGKVASPGEDLNLSEVSTRGRSPGRRRSCGPGRKTPKSEAYDKTYEVLKVEEIARRA